MADSPGDLPWTSAQRVENWAGELRINVHRAAGIVAFYGHHLFNQVVLREPFPPNYTAAVTAVAVAWAAGALAQHVALSNLWTPPALRFLSVGFDALMATSAGPRRFHFSC